MDIFDDLKYMMKPKNIRLLSEKMIIRIIENFFFSMFEYKNFPDSIPRNVAERILIYNGCIAGLKLSEEEANRYNVGLYSGRDVVAPAQPAEEPDFYGMGSKFIVTSGNGYCKTFKPDEIAIGWNNASYSTLKLIIYNTAHDIFTALSALRAGVNYTKHHPIYKSADDKEKAALNELWDKIQTEDDKLTITSTNILETLLTGGQIDENARVINLTDPRLADKIQYVSKCIDDYMRWFLGLYGQTVQGNGKLAQQTVDEVNGQTSSSFILPNDMLHERKLWVERLKKLEIIPEDADIDFSNAWKVEEIKYQKEADINEDGEVEGIEEPIVEPEVPRETSEETKDEEEKEDKDE